jgi:hypothetical protein
MQFDINHFIGILSLTSLLPLNLTVCPFLRSDDQRHTDVPEPRSDVFGLHRESPSAQVCFSETRFRFDTRPEKQLGLGPAGAELPCASLFGASLVKNTTAVFPMQKVEFSNSNGSYKLIA